MYKPEKSVLYALEKSVYYKKNMNMKILHILNRHAIDKSVY